MGASKPTWKRVMQTFAILLILVIFPILSWYFLQTGFDFTKGKYEQLDSLGQVEAAAFPIQQQKDLKVADMSGKIVLAGNLTDIQTESLDIIEGLYRKFDDRQDLIFLFYDRDTTVENRKDVLKEYTFYTDTEQVKIIDALQFEDRRYFEALQLDQPLSTSEMVIVDPGGEVRGKYDLLDQDERDLMISHIIYLIPRD